MAKKASMSAGETGLARSIEARPGAVSRVNAEHYRWGHDCDAWHLVKDQQFTVIEELIPPGAAEVRHYHKKAQQFFYILSGEAIMEVENDPGGERAPHSSRCVAPDSQSFVEHPASARDLASAESRG